VDRCHGNAQTKGDYTHTSVHISSANIVLQQLVPIVAAQLLRATHLSQEAFVSYITAVETLARCEGVRKRSKIADAKSGAPRRRFHRKVVALVTVEQQVSRDTRMVNSASSQH
jgi:hypothetical protein